MNKAQRTRIRNAALEKTNLYGTPKQQHKKWRRIAQELSDRKISLNDIINIDSPKQDGLMELAKQEEMTLGDMVLLRQYSEAIVNGSTKAAEFVRDTMGERPSTQVDINNVDESGISQMSLDELLELKELLKKNIGEK